MQAMTMTKVRDLKEGYLVDLEPALDWLTSRGHLLTVGEISQARGELATVDAVELESSLEADANAIAVIHSTDGGNWALPADMELPRVLRD